MMKRDEVLAVLRQQKQILRDRFGACRLALFGSVARDQATPASDVDILVDFDRPITLFDLAAVRQYLEKTLGVSRVDVVPRDSLFPELTNRILEEAVDVN